MEAKEMRVGNYYDHNGEVLQVTPNVIREVWEAKRTWCKPIKLTEDWLIKFGFQKRIANAGGIAEWNEWKIKRFEIISTGSDEICKNDLCYGTFDFKIKHVHQLQNLYFALTGLELHTGGRGLIYCY